MRNYSLDGRQFSCGQLLPLISQRASYNTQDGSLKYTICPEVAYAADHEVI